MMRVERQPEPPDFNKKVRVRGTRKLRKLSQTRPVPNKFWGSKPAWTKAGKDLGESYGWICAFSGWRIHPVTGSKTVEHFKPKSLYPELAFEWSNYRLVCGILNGRKGNVEGVLDPFELTGSVFELNPISGEIFVHPKCQQRFRTRAENTIKHLRLNDGLCKGERLRNVDLILSGGWSQLVAESESPFVYSRLRAQGLL